MRVCRDLACLKSCRAKVLTCGEVHKKAAGDSQMIFEAWLAVAGKCHTRAMRVEVLVDKRKRWWDRNV